MCEERYAEAAGTGGLTGGLESLRNSINSSSSSIEPPFCVLGVEMRTACGGRAVARNQGFGSSGGGGGGGSGTAAAVYAIDGNAHRLCAKGSLSRATGSSQPHLLGGTL